MQYRLVLVILDGFATRFLLSLMLRAFYFRLLRVLPGHGQERLLREFPELHVPDRVDLCTRHLVCGEAREQQTGERGLVERPSRPTIDLQGAPACIR